MTVDDLVELLRLERLDTYLFRGASPAGGTPRVYGGQLLAQSVMAMGRSAIGQRWLHSLQGYFLRPGDITRDMLFRIEPIREGRGFSTLALSVLQNDKPIFTASASFQAQEGSDEWRASMPRVAEPEALESEEQFLARVGSLDRSNGAVNPAFFHALIERRSADWRHPVMPGRRAPKAGFWCRIRQPLGDDPLVHQALLAYVSDLDLMATAMRPRGIGGLHPAAQAASLDHVMWFHAPVRADRWFYYDIEGACSVGNRGLGRGEIYQDGQLVSTTMQEGLLRVNAKFE
ncbi:acyl-CoA thioesterase [Vreelandella titanicae]|nr:acyl-CoA thioesterase domain-containing protein [Halomonas titanicae]